MSIDYYWTKRHADRVMYGRGSVLLNMPEFSIQRYEKNRDGANESEGKIGVKFPLALLYIKSFFNWIVVAIFAP